MNNTDYKVVVTFNCFAGYAKISFLDTGSKKELIKKYRAMPLSFGDRSYDTPTDVRLYKR